MADGTVYNKAGAEVAVLYPFESYDGAYEVYSRPFSKKIAFVSMDGDVSDFRGGMRTVGSVSSDGTVTKRKGPPVGFVDASGTVSDTKGTVVGSVRGAKTKAVSAGGAALLLVILDLG